MNQIRDFIKYDKYTFVIVEVLDGSTYGFNMKIDAEYDTVQDIIDDNWTYACFQQNISGWKVSKQLTSQVKNAYAWNQFVNKYEHDVVHDSTSYPVEDKEEQENDNDDGEALYEKEKKYKYDDKSSDSDSDDDVDDDDKSIPSNNNSNYYNNESESEKKYIIDTSHKRKYEYSSEENSKVSKPKYQSENDNEYEYSSEEDGQQYNNGICTYGNKISKFKYDSEDDNNASHISKITSESNSGIGVTQFSKLFNNEFATKVKLNMNYSSSQLNQSGVDVFVTGPIHKKNDSYYVVVFGDFKKAYVLKSPFLRSYVKTIMEGLDIDSTYCETYVDINIRDREFGNDDKWKRSKNGKTISRMSAVFSGKSINEAQIMKDIDNAIGILFQSMEKREKHPIGPMVLDFLNQNQNGLYKYLTNNDKKDEEIGEMLTEDIHNQFKSGYTLKWNDSLNRFMVDYDIIRVLKDNIGYKSWEEVGRNNMKKCFRDYNSNNFENLSLWGMEQERY
jgi:hypothetical protein